VGRGRQGAQLLTSGADQATRTMHPMLKRPLAVLPVVAVVAMLALAGCGNESDTSTAADPAPSEATTSAASEEASSPAASGVTCEYPEDPMGAAKPVNPPPATPTETGQLEGAIVTNLGALNGTFDADRAPCTINSLLSLASQGYFSDVVCHRMTTSGIFVLQCGDPTQTGSGGPGYSFADELDGSETYEAGTLAMANAGPNTNGSQFFIVYKDSQLGPLYTVFGHVDDAAVKIIKKVAKKGVDDANGPGDGHPLQEVHLEEITVG
jgi:peptidyl-prolyl cis-trans isomerase B (cyclophilin B)